MTRDEYRERLIAEREELRQQALRLRTEGEGLSYPAIGRELGIHTTKARRLCVEEPSPTANKTWARWEVIEAIREWELGVGDLPKQDEWKRRDRPYWCPSPATVRRIFGSWNAAIREAGYEPRDACPPLYVVRHGLNLVGGGRGQRGGTQSANHPWRRSIKRDVERSAA